MLYPVYKFAVWSGTAFALAFWAGTEAWGSSEFTVVSLLIAPLYAPMAYRVLRHGWMRRRQNALGMPDARNSDILAFLTEALDSAGLDWEWRPKGDDPQFWTEFVIDEGEAGVFVTVESGVVEVQAYDEDPEVFLDVIESLHYIMLLKGISDPIDKEIPFDSDLQESSEQGPIRTL